MIHHRKVDVHDYLLNRIIRIRVAIWLYARPNKSIWHFWIALGREIFGLAFWNNNR